MGLKKSGQTAVFSAVLLVIPGSMDAGSSPIGTTRLGWDETISSVKNNNIPAMIYFGARNSPFIQRGLSKETKLLISEGKIAFGVVDMTEESAYPLTGIMAPNQKLADLVGAIAGSVIFINRSGYLVEEHRIPVIIHDNDPVIIHDLVKYHIENRDPKTVPLTDYMALTGNEVAWSRFFERAGNPTPLIHVPKTELRYEYKDANGKLIALKNLPDDNGSTITIVTEKIDRLVVVMVKNIFVHFDGKLMIKILARESERKIFQEQLGSLVFPGKEDKVGVSFGSLQGKTVFEYPLNIFTVNGVAILFRGYMQAELINLLLPGGVPKLAKPSLDPNIAIGDYNIAVEAEVAK